MTTLTTTTPHTCNRAHPPTAWCPAALPDAPCPAADDGRHRGERDADERGAFIACGGCGFTKALGWR